MINFPVKTHVALLCLTEQCILLLFIALLTLSSSIIPLSHASRSSVLSIQPWPSPVSSRAVHYSTLALCIVCCLYLVLKPLFLPPPHLSCAARPVPCELASACGLNAFCVFPPWSCLTKSHSPSRAGHGVHTRERETSRYVCPEE